MAESQSTSHSKACSTSGSIPSPNEEAFTENSRRFLFKEDMIGRLRNRASDCAADTTGHQQTACSVVDLSEGCDIDSSSEVSTSDEHYVSCPTITAHHGAADLAEGTQGDRKTLVLGKNVGPHPLFVNTDQYDDYVDQVAENVMGVLATYFWCSDDDTGIENVHWPGGQMFKGHAMHWIRRDEPIRLTLPAFPFKSSNPEKVTGSLPDCGEYLGLQRLNQICLDIGKVYSRGGKVIIATDGAAFNDLLLISDEDVWNYGQAIRAMVQSNGFSKNIEVLHAMEILELIEKDQLSEEGFYETIGQCREMIKDQFCAGEDEIRWLVNNDPDSRLTFTGFKAFCKVDMDNTPMKKQAVSQKAYMKEIASLALNMMARSEGFGKLIRAKMPNHIRLSIHPSSGAVKLSICLIPQPAGSVARSPWMSCVAVGKDGMKYTAHTKDVRATHNLVLKDGMPWLYRERASPPLANSILERNRIFEELWQQQLEKIRQKPRDRIIVTVNADDGKCFSLNATAWDSTPASILEDLPKVVGKDVAAVKVDGELSDLNRPFEQDCTVSYVKFDSCAGQEVMWRSSAYCLGEVCEREYRCLLAHSELGEQGYLCDIFIPNGGTIDEDSWSFLEARVSQLVNDKRTFDRLEVSKDDLQKMFAHNKYRTHYIDSLADEEMTTVYRCGTLVDICRDPHIHNTGKIGAFKILQQSSSSFLESQQNDPILRLKVIAFPDKKRLQEHLQFLKVAEKGSHVNIGKEQELFFFHDTSLGSPFLLPHGTHIFNALQKLMRQEYRRQGYKEVQTPNMYDAEHWKTSGHLRHYQNQMIKLEMDKRQWVLKPVNHPGYSIVFAHRDRSYKELPLRFTDFSVLHRNEAPSELGDLTRVRKFHQDGTHVFCRPDQVAPELERILNSFESIYALFDLTFKLKLSTRPSKYLGDLATLAQAEDQLRCALTKFRGRDWVQTPGNGAFYGPKIDITVSGASKRQLQCASIQLDYQSPVEFDLKYADQNDTARPVVIHHTTLGSFERFLAILTEHFAGKWPFWMSPRQILIVPVAPAVNGYAMELQNILCADGLNVDADLGGNTFQKKIRTGQLAQYNFIFGKDTIEANSGVAQSVVNPINAVVGSQEKDSRSINIRNRDDPASQTKGVMTLVDEARAKLRMLRKGRGLVNSL
ncbi:Threonyl-tRNA synthetase [Cladobotryum mycophilum]|uniref:threonine--tRNA ligase n=1 Tax=Cladobotryum mycophilum TaxID=491253 RepID=A0ABR0SW86_9HYPO